MQDAAHKIKIDTREKKLCKPVFSHFIAFPIQNACHAAEPRKKRQKPTSILTFYRSINTNKICSTEGGKNKRPREIDLKSSLRSLPTIASFDCCTNHRNIWFMELMCTISIER